jgi:hypothetical protein
MSKIILTLAAIAVMATSALAPTSAHAVRQALLAKRPANAHVGRAARPVIIRNNVRNNIRNNVNVRIGVGGRPAWHRAGPGGRGPVRFGYRQHWPRPGFVRRYGAPVGVGYAAPAGVGYAAPVGVVAAPYAAAPAPVAVQPAMQPQVDGLNVVMVAVPDGQFSMSGHGQWTRTVNNGNTFQFAELGRDASSVTLNDASRGVQVILDLSQRKVLLAGPNGTTRPIFPIVNVSAR